ncbi:hypothetical protein F511_05288 [Dorcoceras hygrometricum]|uniref:Uncharacterized protein n=1 Tax=Dorcoceras hygrometricum TaxID=472368 RepID=A0A2Z7AKJ7_9LAMI|nr:hypothetical protein F511_05288 [Dorcoceras hygrometricum]
MIVDLIGIFVLKGSYCMLTMTDWFLQALSVIPRGSWGDVARRFTMIRWFPERSIDHADSIDITPGVSWSKWKAQNTIQLTFRVSNEQPTQVAGEHQAPKPTAEEQVEEVDRSVENIEGNEALNSPELQDHEHAHQAHRETNLEAEQEVERQAPTGFSHSSPRDSHSFVQFSSSNANNEDRQGPSSSGLQIVVYTEQEEEITSADNREEYPSWSATNKCFETQADLDADNKLKEVQKVVLSLESKIVSMDLSDVSLDLKVDRIMDA